MQMTWLAHNADCNLIERKSYNLQLSIMMRLHLLKIDNFQTKNPVSAAFPQLHFTTIYKKLLPFPVSVI